ncbi:hypothetical protein F503_00800 [Ophiostoma piceae UAMH 11346]|uniref:Uncharacterized protein n=1 Tax=Ophiostoma piceae (strain UAMH 11346) TaxID=1262450 RepID=S3C5D8_OPHP1|nr:hypothetical protein F503_00800 [Ophiostoma piceae UAMH 11346]
MSPETASPVFPDRLIHPLPKRRLRERLSPDVASTIKYPPSLTTGTPLFYYPFNLKDDATSSGERAVAAGRTNAAVPIAKTNETARAAASGAASSVQPIPSSAAAVVPSTQPAAGQTIRLPSHTRRPSTEPESPSAARVARLVNRTTRASHNLRTAPVSGHQPFPSTASSVDGYECFENTNNKKKRKIPTAGDTPLSGSYTSTDLHSATSASSAANSNDESGVSSPLSTNYSGTASFASVSPGISGPGRGRYGRTRGGRSPLHAITDANSNWAGRYGKLWSPWPMPSETDDITPTPTQGKNGIISSAIANAEKQVSHGQENEDEDYDDQLSAMSTPASAQFTFTCSSQVPGNLMWPGSDPKMPPGSSYVPGRARGGQGQAPSAAVGTDGGSSAGSSGGRRAQQEEKKKRSSKIRQELKAQIRERRRAQRERNAANPQMDDFYVCPFCDYEIITGRKSKLITAFELKERKKRLETERRQRERAKDRSRNKGRRGRKATVTNADANARQGTVDEEQQYDGAIADDPDAGELEDEIYDDDDDEAGEADDVVPELRSGIGDTHNQRSRGRDGEGGRLRDDAG